MNKKQLLSQNINWTDDTYTYAIGKDNKGATLYQVETEFIKIKKDDDKINCKTIKLDGANCEILAQNISKQPIPIKKYYIEIADSESSSNYIFQSKWYNTEEDALEFARQINYLHGDFTISLMSSEWDCEDDTYIDINVERNLNKELKL